MTPRNVATWMPESSYFRTHFQSQRVHGYYIAETTMAALLSQLSTDGRRNELEKVCVSEVWNLRSIW